MFGGDVAQRLIDFGFCEIRCSSCLAFALSMRDKPSRHARRASSSLCARKDFRCYGSGTGACFEPCSAMKRNDRSTSFMFDVISTSAVDLAIWSRKFVWYCSRRAMSSRATMSLLGSSRWTYLPKRQHVERAQCDSRCTAMLEWHHLRAAIPFDFAAKPCGSLAKATRASYCSSARFASAFKIVFERI